MENPISIVVLAISTFAGGFFGDAPERASITEPLVIEKEVEFKCEDDMPCAHPELRVSWLDDIEWCSENYQIPGYYDQFMGCLDEVRYTWTVHHV